ncbi:unnamed protein product [Effrenium voratum]|nr:unnamed protein product [Effrenium voratum]
MPAAGTSLHRAMQAARLAGKGEVPSKEGMMFTAGLMAAIMVVAVCLALMYQSSGRTVRREGIPGAPRSSEDAPETQDTMTSTSMRKPKPACC